MTTNGNASTVAAVEASIEHKSLRKAISMSSVGQQKVLRQGNVYFLPTFGQPKLKQKGWASLPRALKHAVPDLFQTEAYLRRSR